ncbi:hypothetical protein BH09BAC5_BH09BAC5_04980 [soil metagenome]
MKKITLLFSAFLLMAFTFTGETLSEKNYKIYSVKDKKEIKLDDIVSNMKNYDVIFFGEEHNDSVGHYLEIELLKKMHATYGSNLALSMEMFETDCQLVLDEYLQGFIREKNFKKEGRAWSNYKDYRPMIEFAKEKKMEVVAGNAPARYVNMAGRMGESSLLKLSPEAKKYLPPLPYDTATGKYFYKLGGIGPESPKPDSATLAMQAMMQMPPFGIHSQSLWDASMAYSIATCFKKDKTKKIMQVNGRFHSDEYYGIVAQLRKYNPEIRILVISCLSDDQFPKTDFSQYTGNGDYIIATDPKVPKTF